MKYALGLALAIGLFTISSLGFPHYNALAWLDATIGTSLVPKDDAVAAPAVPLSITTLGVALTQNFDTLSNTAGSTTNNLTITGWEMTETGGGARDNEQYAVDTGASNTGDTFSYGSAASTERALGSLQSGTLISTFGASFTNNTGQTINGLDIEYVGEQWRISNNAAARDDRLDFQFSLDATSLTTGTWTNVNDLDFTNPIKTGVVGALNGNDPANRVAVGASVSLLAIPDGATFYIRWTDLNASGADDGLAIDDFSITAQAVAQPGTLSFDPTAYSALEDSGTVTLTVTRTGGTDGVVTVDYGEVSSSVNKFGIAGPATGGSSCDEGIDYVRPNGTLTWADGEGGSKTFAVTLCADTTVEPAESFQVSLFNFTGGAAIGASTANVNIQNDDTSVQFSAAEYIEDESQSMAVIVFRDGAIAGSSTVSYSITAGTATAGADCSGSADYVPVSGTIEFGPFDGVASLPPIVLCSDVLADANETFTVTLSNPTGTGLGAIPSAVGTIRDTASQHRFTAQMTPTANYPGTISVASGPSNVGSVKVTLFDLFYDGNPTNIDVLLVAPDGRNIILMADTSDGTPLLTPTTITFSDQAGQVLPFDGPLTSGTYEPTSYGVAETDFPSPAPAGPYNEPGAEVGEGPSMSSVFAGTSAVGDWQLFIRSDAGAGFQRMGGGEVTIEGGWGLQLLAPSAAPATISGRVTDVRGRSVGNAIVSVQGMDGIVRRFTTNSFGYYRFDGLAAGASYVVSVNARRHTFTSRVVSLEDNMADLDFVALP